jgi:hypothetical protein
VVNSTLVSKALALAVLLPFTLSLECAIAQDLRLDLSFDKEQYIPGEPIAAYVEVTNVGTEPAWVDSRLDAELMTVTYTITDPKGEERVFLPYSVADAAHPGVELAPGESVRDISLLHFGASGWTFGEEGRYTIRASYRGDRHQSEVVRLSVVTPPAEPDRQFSRQIMDEPEVGKFFLFEEGDHLASALTLLERLAEEADESVLGAYASYMLGSAYSKSFTVPGDPTGRALDARAAAHYLEEAKDRLPSAYFTIKAYMLLELNYERMGQDTTRVRTVESLERAIDTRFPDRAAFQPLIADQIQRRYLDRS